MSECQHSPPKRGERIKIYEKKMKMKMKMNVCLENPVSLTKKKTKQRMYPFFASNFYLYFHDKYRAQKAQQRMVITASQLQIKQSVSNPLLRHCQSTSIEAKGTMGFPKTRMVVVALLLGKPVALKFG